MKKTASIYLREYHAIHEFKDVGAMGDALIELDYEVNYVSDHQDGAKVDLAIVYGFSEERISRALSRASKIYIKADVAFAHILFSAPPKNYTLIRAMNWRYKQKIKLKNNIKRLKEILRNEAIVSVWCESNKAKNELSKITDKAKVCQQIIKEPRSSDQDQRIKGKYVAVGNFKRWDQKNPNGILIYALFLKILGRLKQIEVIGPFPSYPKWLLNLLSISLIGEQSRKTVISKMRSAEALLMPSRYEGSPNVQIEALYNGANVITELGDGINEYKYKGAATYSLKEYLNTKSLRKYEIELRDCTNAKILRQFLKDEN